MLLMNRPEARGALEKNHFGCWRVWQLSVNLICTCCKVTLALILIWYSCVPDSDGGVLARRSHDE